MIFKEISNLFSLLNRARRAKRSITFYAEHAVYHQFLEPIYSEILKHSDWPIFYITSHAKDPVLQESSERFTSLYLKTMLPYALSMMQTSGIVMTMPDLGVFHIRRSAAGAHHFYAFHAMMSTHMIYRKEAFNHYDTIFCVGAYQAEEIRVAEERYALAPKKLIEGGYAVLDKVYKAHLTYKDEKKGVKLATCLIAPSWAPGNIMESCIEPLTEELLSAGYAVKIRPHPEYLKRQAKAFRPLEARLAQKMSVEFELGATDSRSLHEADILITDWSGIAFEYAFGTERPVLFVDTPKKINNPGYGELELEPFEIRARELIGTVLNPVNLEEAVSLCKRLLDEKAAYAKQIRNVRSQNISHLGDSAQFCAKSILERLRARRVLTK